MAPQRSTPRLDARGNAVGVVGPCRRRDLRRAFTRLRAARDDVHRAAGGAAAIQHGPARAQNLDALDRGERNRSEVGRREFVLRDPLTVHQDQRVLVAGDAETAQVDLTVRAAGIVANGEPDFPGQHFRQCPGSAVADLLRSDDRDADRRLLRLLFEPVGGDDDFGRGEIAFGKRDRRRDGQ